MESATVRRPPPLPGLIQLGLIGLLLVLAVLAWKLTDVQMAFPSILLALAIMVVLGAGVRNLIIVLGVANWVLFARVPYYQAYPGFWGWVVVVYLFTLGLEMTVLLAGRPPQDKQVS